MNRFEDGDQTHPSSISVGNMADKKILKTLNAKALKIQHDL